MILSDRRRSSHSSVQGQQARQLTFLNPDHILCTGQTTGAATTVLVVKAAGEAIHLSQPRPLHLSIS